ncbi:SUMF1/EgtB/PvdO family nonheme iron enzyme [Runella sp. MFBS21]|uniref:SUMF1/EgtB/PvdO family nonheme iron enzyme n=1 Tax=Runella sp. MFBS21 TaxID=3034018 RepID=UPI0023F9442C|nr:SUMF1/EgtB/PvdO family nonheme iron enzyme [Runella sp. MFBS21]MDF7821830.1 SUMF1/EgtB/PvdO family nonheme iron enzyme [Runella sp. MFBS21]
MKQALLLIFCFCISSLQAQRGFKTTASESEKRLALVIGNAAYTGQALTNPLNDARAMRTTLQELGFEVHYYENLSKAGQETALLKFVAALKSYSVGLFYFAGHGFESKEKVNYLMSTDVTSDLNEVLAKDKSLSLDVVIESMREANAKTNLLLVDACRNNPFRSWSRDGAKGLGSVNPPLGTVVFFAASPGQQADDNRGGKNGLFTEELLTQLKTPNLELVQILKNTSRAVYKRSGSQVPSLTGQLLDDFYFLPQSRPSSNTTDPEPYTPPKREEPVRVEPAKAKTKTFMDLPFAEMAYVEGGTFQMGDEEGDSSEKPVHSVTLSSFYMSKYEITQRQWESVMGSNPSSFKDCADCPVENVSWEDIQEFLKKLNARTGGKYRLPTEAEWEYAAGGGSGTRTRFGNGRDVLDAGEANFDARAASKASYSTVGEDRKKTLKVGSFRPNGLGLYDMTGNVLEWCSDWYGAYSSSGSINPTGPTRGSNRVLRGGSWFTGPANNRVAFRYDYTPSLRNSSVGFRVVSLQ